MDLSHPIGRNAGRPRSAARMLCAALFSMLACASGSSGATSVSANYFTFADNGSFIAGDADSSTTRSRAIVDSGFVHRQILISGHSTSDWTWYAKASASLATGTLRVYAFSDTTDSHATEESPMKDHGWRTQSTAAWTEVVTFVAPANAPAGVAVPITFHLDVDGSFAGSFAAMASSTFLLVNGVKSQVDFAWGGELGPSGSNDATATTLGTVTGLAVDPRQLHALLSVTAMVAPGNPIVMVANAFARAAAGPFASVTSDFDHTATLSIEAPAGYTFTSQSGVLLSVPEPGTWLSLGVGLCVVAMTGRVRRRTSRRGLDGAQAGRFA